MKIAFDAKRYFSNHTGLGNYSREILNHWLTFYPQDELLLASPKKPNSYDPRPGMDVIHAPRGVPGAIWRAMGQGSAAAQWGAHVYFGLSNELPMVLPRQMRSMVAIHDCLFMAFPEQYGPINCQIYQFKTQHALDRADVVVAVSEATRRDLIQHFRVDPVKINVVYQTISGLFNPTINEEVWQGINLKHSIASEFILCVGSLYSRKNQHKLVEAYSKLMPSERIPLYVIGKKDTSYGKKVVNEVNRLKLNQWIVFLDQLSLPEIAELYKHAVFSVYVSLGEGFGLPVVESLACGTPVLTSNVSAMPEAALGLGHLADPFSSSSIENSLRNLLSNHQNLRAQIREKRSLLNQFDRSNQIHSLRKLMDPLS
jgi:glycosyltransferase involved in cell wall biosynthesis